MIRVTSTPVNSHPQVQSHRLFSTLFLFHFAGLPSSDTVSSNAAGRNAAHIASATGAFAEPDNHHLRRHRYDVNDLDDHRNVSDEDIELVELLRDESGPPAETTAAAAGQGTREPQAIGRWSVDRRLQDSWDELEGKFKSTDEKENIFRLPHLSPDQVEYWSEALRQRQQQRQQQRNRGDGTEPKMKFSHSLQFNAVPDWSAYYIAYSNLKKL